MEHSFSWIMSCIESSTNAFQFKCCQTLIGLFETMYKDTVDNIQQMVTDLEFELYEQKIKHGIEI